MSQVQPLPPPPIGPARDNSLLIPAIVIGALVLLGLFGSFELRLLNSRAGKEAAQKIRQDPRVRAEFGNDVHIPFALAWDSGDQAEIYAYISASRAHGYAMVDLLKLQNDWLISALQINDKTEGHILTLINASQHSTPATKEQLQGPYTLYFVALGDSAQPDADDLVRFFQDQFGISAKTLPSIALPAYTYDARRKQRVAELSTQAIESKYPEIAADPEARVIGIVDDDLYIRDYNWAYTYSYRGACCKYSVIPTVRLGPAFYHFPPNASIRRERLRKVAMKAVGLLYLGFKESSDPQSVDAVEASVEDIDRMGMIYLASDVQTRISNSAADGRPCLTFYSSNVAGSSLQNPIVPCLQEDQDSEGTQYHIDLAQGRFELTRNDLYRGGAIPLVLQRMHFSHHFNDKVHAFGEDSWQNLDDSVWSADPNSIQTINIDGTQFHRMTPGTGFSPDARYSGAADGSNFSNAWLSWENGGWRVDTRNGEVWRYLGCSANSRVQCYYIGHRNFRGDSIEIKRDPTSGHIEQIRQKTNNDLPDAAALDHTWTPLYDGDKMIEIRDSDGRIARYRYDQQQHLTDVEADSHTIHQDYDDVGRITGIVEDGRSLRIHYDSEGRPDRIDFPNGSAYGIKYSQDAIEISMPGKSYTVTVLPTFFRIVEHKEQ
jgi:YD repeat-containing protein